MAEQLAYCAYMLRAWREESEEGASDNWRVRLRNIQTGDEHGFVDVDEALQFLRESLLQETGPYTGPDN